jgi:Plasmid pRiA4b ORF-3-like protein
VQLKISWEEKMDRNITKPVKLDKLISSIEKLPRIGSRVIIVGRAVLHVYVRENKEYYKPYISLFVDEKDGLVLDTQITLPLYTKDEAVSETLQMLLKIIGGTYSVQAKQMLGKAVPRPGLPHKIIITDQKLLDAALPIFNRLKVPLEFNPAHPEYNNAFTSLAENMGADENAEPPQPFEWILEDETLLSPLYEAAAEFWRRKAWDSVGSDVPFDFDLSSAVPEFPHLYPVILGNGGEVFGVVAHLSLADFEESRKQGEIALPADEKIDQAIALLKAGGMPVDEVPPEVLREIVAKSIDDLPDVDLTNLNVITMFFELAEENDPTYLDWLRAKNLKIPKNTVPIFQRVEKGFKSRLLDVSEVKAMTAILETYNDFGKSGFEMIEKSGEQLPESGIMHRVRVGKDQAAVSFQFPAEGYREAYLELFKPPSLLDMFDPDEFSFLSPPEPKKPPTAAALSTLYRFKVTLEWETPVWFRVEMSGDQTLDDLHNVIQEAFDWDDDHLYAFFLSGRAWDTKDTYESHRSRDGKPASMYRLSDVKLKVKQNIMYIFDFGDEWRHRILVEDIIPKGVDPNEEYPRITKQVGKAPPQYGFDDDDDEEEDEDD